MNTLAWIGAIILAILGVPSSFAAYHVGAVDLQTFLGTLFFFAFPLIGLWTQDSEKYREKKRQEKERRMRVEQEREQQRQQEEERLREAAFQFFQKEQQRQQEEARLREEEFRFWQDQQRRFWQQQQRQQEEQRRQQEAYRRQYEQQRRQEEQRRRQEQQRASSKSTEDRYHEILGTKPGMSFDEIKKAYHQKVQQYHPDKVSQLGEKLREVAEEEMKKINEAYNYFEQKYK